MKRDAGQHSTLPPCLAAADHSCPGFGRCFCFVWLPPQFCLPMKPHLRTYPSIFAPCQL